MSPISHEFSMRMLARGCGRVIACLLTSLVFGCAVGPDYARPKVETPSAYKELQGWKVATPRGVATDGRWWMVFQDPMLDGLEAQVEVSNQNLKAAEAAYREAQALVDQARAGYFPDITAAFGKQRGKGGNTLGITQPTNQYSLSAGASWVPDIWGRIRRTVESDAAHAEASAADLAAARLSAQAALAIDYFELRIDDEQQHMLDETVTAYQESLQITQNQYTAGIVSQADVASAQSQLQAARAQAINTNLQRTLLEHAIAVLAGKPPAEFELAALPPSADINVPVMPAELPSILLEHRPDIAAAEREMAAANAGIGVAESAYFPDLTLTASDGFASSALGGLISAPNRVWSVGIQLAGTVFDFGAHGAAVDQARAAYDGAVATYRQTVLSAFQQVEDELATLRLLEQEAVVQDAAVQAAHESVRITRNQYKAGIVAYTNVVVAQNNELDEEQTAFSIRANRLVASIALIEALGGGWSTQSPVDTGADAHQ